MRVVWILLAAERPNAPFIADPIVYEAMAEQTRHGVFFRGPQWPLGNGEPTSFLSVGYPTVLAGLMFVSIDLLDAFQAAMVLNVLAGLAVIVGVAIIADRLGGPLVVATGAAWVTALYPDFVTGSVLVMSDLVALALLVWVAVVVTDLARPRWPALGLLVGATIWVRPAYQLILAVVPLVVWLVARSRPAAWRTFAVAAVVLAPLAYHSTVTVEAGPGFTSATIINLCEGVALDPGVPNDGRFHHSMRCDDGSGDEQNWLARSRRVAFDEIRARPLRYVGSIPLRLSATFAQQGWGIDVTQEWSHRIDLPERFVRYVRSGSTAAYLAVVAAAIPAMIRLRRRRELQVSAVLAATTLVGVVFAFGMPRYAIGTIALVLIPCASAAVSMWRSPDPRWWDGPQPSSIIAPTDEPGGEPSSSA